MEKLTLKIDSINAITEYRDANNLATHERKVLEEVISALEKNDVEQVQWFKQFGDSISCIVMNVHQYRKGLEFGFTEIELGTYQWLKRPALLKKEDLTFGNAGKYSEHSTIRLGRGINGIWTYAIDYTLGLAGGGYALSVFGKQFKNREDSLSAAMINLKNTMVAKIGDKDTSNFKQPIIQMTLWDIAKMQINMVQLSLF